MEEFAKKSYTNWYLITKNNNSNVYVIRIPAYSYGDKNGYVCINYMTYAIVSPNSKEFKILPININYEK